MSETADAPPSPDAVADITSRAYRLAKQIISAVDKGACAALETKLHPVLGEFPGDVQAAVLASLLGRRNIAAGRAAELTGRSKDSVVVMRNHAQMLVALWVEFYDAHPALAEKVLREFSLDGFPLDLLAATGSRQ